VRGVVCDATRPADVAGPLDALFAQWQEDLSQNLLGAVMTTASIQDGGAFTTR
jgi:hypothetical protein